VAWWAKDEARNDLIASDVRAAINNGRSPRLHDGKRIVQVYDYADIREPMLARMYERRLKGYAAIGYELVSVSSGDDQQLTLDPAGEN
jgi:hypothetical protein